MPGFLGHGLVGICPPEQIFCQRPAFKHCLRLHSPWSGDHLPNNKELLDHLLKNKDFLDDLSSLSLCGGAGRGSPAASCRNKLQGSSEGLRGLPPPLLGPLGPGVVSSPAHTSCPGSCGSSPGRGWAGMRRPAAQNQGRLQERLQYLLQSSMTNQQ